MYTFLIVDDHAIVRHGITTLIKNVYHGCHCMEAGNGEECMQLARNNKFDIIILDISLPNTDSLGLTDWLMLRDPQSKILIFSAYPGKQYGIQYYKKGVMGYINKETGSEEILRAIDLVLHNRIYMAQDFQSSLPAYLKQERKAGIDQLSDREFAVAQALAQGYKYGEIARILNIEVSTVRTFKIRIFKKLNVQTLFEFLQLFHNSCHEK